MRGINLWRVPRCGLLIWLLLAPVVAKAGAVLEIRDVHQHAVLLQLPLDAGERIGYRYVHSLEHVPIEEVYQLRGNQLVQVMSRSPSFGVGHLPEDVPLVREKDTGWQRAMLPARPVTPLFMYIPAAELSPFVLEWRGREIPLNPPFAQRHVRIDVRFTDTASLQ